MCARSAVGWSVIVALLSFACAGGTAPEASAPAPPPPAALPAAVAAARPLYYDRAIVPADLEGRTLRELSLSRNTIFARAGQPFVKPWLNEYFRAQAWYQPAEKQDLSRLSDVDRANVSVLALAEANITRPELIARRDAVRARASGSGEDAIEMQLISAALGEWSGDAAVPVAERNPLADPTVLERQLSVGQIEGLSRRDLRLLRNTIYARHGRPFQSPVLSNYFADKAWYSPAASYADASLTDIDKRNIQLVQSMEDRLGGPMKEWEQQQADGWFDGA